VPTFKGPDETPEDETELESEELKLDIDITSLRVELQSCEQEASGFTTL